MRILLTGHSGFVGSACAEHLAAAGHEVVGLSRAPTGSLSLSEEIDRDIGRRGLVADVGRRTERCAAIVHAAASRSYDDDAPELALTNVLGTQQLIALAQFWESERFVFLSGLTVIGRPESTPITEAHPTAPKSAYLATKLLGEQLVTIASGAGLGGIALRLSAPVGPGMPEGRIMAAFARRAQEGEALTVLGRGTRRQNYVDVRDVSQAVSLAVSREVVGTFNIAGPRSISNRELAELCIETAQSDSEIVEGGDDPEEGLSWEVSTDAARRALGFDPQLGPAETVADLIAARAGPGQ